MAFCPYITTQIMSTSVTDGTNTDYTYTTSLYTCPENNTCKVWGDDDCGSKSPAAETPGPSPTSLLTEFITKTNIDDLDLSSLGVVTGDGIYGFDFMIDDVNNIPSILKAAHDHPDFDDSTLLDRVSGEGDLTISQYGFDSTAEWIYEMEATAWDSTDDFVTSGVIAGTSKLYMTDVPEAGYKSLTVTTRDSATVLTMNIGIVATTYPNVPISVDSYEFIVDRKRINWAEYNNLF